MKTILFLLLLIFFSSYQSKEQTVSFSKDVKPILVRKCVACHSHEEGGEADLFLNSYEDLMNGKSENGPVVVPMRGEESIFIKKLRGTAGFGKQMPPKRAPLDEKTIILIRQWIDQGAKKN